MVQNEPNFVSRLQEVTSWPFRSLIDENGGGPGVRLLKRQQKKN
jgi:hypothetical protein